MNEALTDCLSNMGVRQPDLRKVAVSLRSSSSTTWVDVQFMMIKMCDLYQDSLRQRILATIVIVDAVVGDLFSNLTADRAEDYHGTREAEQAKPVVSEEDALVLDLVLAHPLPAVGHPVCGYSKADDEKS